MQSQEEWEAGGYHPGVGCKLKGGGVHSARASDMNGMESVGEGPWVDTLCNPATLGT